MNTNRNDFYVVRLSEEAGIKETGELRAYLVDAAGNITDTARFDGLEARIKSAGEGEKVYVGPSLPQELPASKANERTLAGIGAYQAVKNFGGSNIIDIQRLPDTIFQFPPFRFCNVTGHVNKNFVINGQTTNLPVCNARVHICNVERIFWIPIYFQPQFTIPDWVLEELKYKLATVNQPVIKVPPRPDPGPLRAAAFTKQNLSLRSLTTKRKTTTTIQASKLQALPDHILNEIQSATTESIQQSLIQYHDVLYPYLCLWPVFWPWFYSVEEEAVVYTDCNGHFGAWLFVAGNNTQENIYTWVEVNINGQWVTVYKPPYPCYTKWNYACGTNINITVTDARVLPCYCGTEGPGDAFWFRSIGSSAGALHIEQNPFNTRLIQGAPFSNVGCTNILGYDYISPFGATLNLAVFAGENVYSSGTGVTHFRWKATRIKDENLTPISLGSQSTMILNAADKISREYIVHLDTFHYHSFSLDIAPSGAGNDIAFRIPNQNIALESTITAAFPGKVPGVDIFWRDIFWTGGSVDSHSLSDGLYRFDLELGTYNGAGNFVVTDVNPATFQVSQLNDLDSSQDPSSAYLHMNGALAKNFTMLVRIDNAPCHADILDAQLLETGALSGPCGFIIYTDKDAQHIHISFEASQPRGFATFGFSIIKGNNTEDTGIHPGGYVNTGVGDFSLLAGTYSDDITVASLLGNCPGQAAFSENLSVYSIATDGSNRLSGYDAGDVNAFALSNT